MAFENQKKVGIMGGTFDPIHIGHLMLAQQALDEHELDEIWFMPSRIPPHKDCANVTVVADRENMVKLAITGNERFVYSDLELHREGTTYTSDTLLELDESYPDNVFYFIMGADSLFHIETWHEPQTIFDHAIILASNRDDYSDEAIEKQIAYLEEKYHGTVKLITLEANGISSSDIREMRYNGYSGRYYVPEGVYHYMEENHLYRN